ncbi:RAN binding protein 3-like [Cricetulus griseus]
MRNQGSLRLILNSRLWTQMKIQRANHKNLRITATDLEDDGIKVFLIQASANDIGYLYAAIHHRLVALRSLQKQADGDPAESQSDTVLQQFSCDEDEDDFIQVTKDGSGLGIVIWPRKLHRLVQGQCPQLLPQLASRYWLKFTQHEHGTRKLGNHESTEVKMLRDLAFPPGAQNSACTP